MNRNRFDRTESSPAGSLEFSPPIQGVFRHSRSHSKARSLSSSPLNDDWISPFTLPPLPTLRRDRILSDELRSPEQLRQRDSSGAYYAAAWGSPYATPSPRRTPQPVDSANPSSSWGTTSPRPGSKQHRKRATPRTDLDSIAARLDRQSGSLKDLRDLHSERPNWLSDSEESGSDTHSRSRDRTPTKVADLGSWGPSPVSSIARRPAKHRSTESLATVTQDTFHEPGNLSVKSRRFHTPLPSIQQQADMAEHDGEQMQSTGKPLPVLPRRPSVIGDGNPPSSPTAVQRPQPTSMQSYQRPKKKVIWKGKSCIIALPLTDREAAGLPALLTSQEIKDRIKQWTASGYSVNGFEHFDPEVQDPGRSSGQSRPVYPDPVDLTAERKLRRFEVHVPDQAEWESWVNYLQEEKLRALGVSPSSSEAPPSTRSPFSPAMSQASSMYPRIGATPPIAPSSSASNPLRATSNPFSPALMSPAGISPQPGSGISSQFNVLPKSFHGYKQSTVSPHLHGRASPYDGNYAQQPSGTNGRLHALSSRQQSFSPHHQPLLPTVGEVLSQSQHMRAPTMGGGQAPNTQSSGHPHLPDAGHILSPALSNSFDPLRTPQYSDSSRTPIEIAHPTPKSHRHNLSVALQREIDEAEAALHAKHESLQAEPSDYFGVPAETNPAVDDSVTEEPPILRRPETMSGNDDKSDIDTNPSLAATPMLMDDKNPFVNWQSLSDAVQEDTTAAALASHVSKFNVEAKEFDPKAGFSSSNFTFGGPETSFGLPQPKAAAISKRPSPRNKMSVSHLNADAPAFTPSFASSFAPQETSKSMPFTFGSAAFNVEAPAFNPSQSPGTNFKRGMTSDEDKPARNLNSIFGNVVIDPGSKATRRPIKAMPIVRAKSEELEEKSSDSGSESNDDEGRPMAPADRMKRARRHDSDGDRSPIYADSAPFHHRKILSEIVDDAEINGLPIEDPKKNFDGWSYVPADDSLLTEDRATSPIEGEQETEDKRHSTFKFDDENDASIFNEARPPFDIDEKLDHDRLAAETSPAVVKQEIETPLKPTALPEASSDKVRSILSATAKPFEFNPRVSRSRTSSSFNTPSKPQGLEASKYAAPSSPPMEISANMSSPPSDVPHYVQKDHESVDDDEDTVEVFEEKSDDENVVEVIEEGSNSEEERPHHRYTISAPPVDLDPVERRVPELQDHVLSSSPRRDDHPVPSFEEIDAVMKHLENYPELGIERNDTPIQSTSHVDMLSTPLIDLRPNMRSDAPSPSPRRMPDTKVAQSDNSYPPSYGLGIGVHNLNSGGDDVSDWGEALSAPEAAKLQLRSQFFDGHVNDLVGGILEDRLGPLERALQTIQASLAAMATQPRARKQRRSASNEQKDSDADDEDDYDAFEGYAEYRNRSPVAKRGELKQDSVRAAIVEALAVHQESQVQPSIDMTEVNAVLQEMRQLAQNSGSQSAQSDLKTIMEDVISQHPRLRGNRVRDTEQVGEAKYKPQIDGLETMLKISQEHAAEEAKRRRAGEEEIIELKLRLRIAEEESAQYKESSEEAQQTMEAFVEEKESFKALERELEGLSLKNTALEDTLQEYRASSEKWREDIANERSNNRDLKRTLQDLHQQLHEQTESRSGLRAKIERVQSQMAQVVQDMHAEQEDWRNKEHALEGELSRLHDTLDRERRHRENAEAELDELDKEHKANLHLKTMLEQAQSNVSRLNDLVVSLQDENKVLDTKAFSLDRELEHLKASKDAELATSTAKLQAELEGAKMYLVSIRTDSEAQISRLQKRLDHTELDLEEQKAQHDSLLTETVEAHQQALREASEKKELALEDQHQLNEKKLNELRDRHTRELHNSFDNRSRLEHQFNEKQSLSDDKVKHLESKVEDLEDRLQITRSAARAAVEAATAKGVNLPTPASSVVASPPQRAATASLALTRGSDLPEKISPQALRESIMVLQDQLQNREQRIEQLEADIAAIDKEAPVKLKDRETEIGWLRELLSVKADDLEDIINALSKPDFDRESVRDATIRLRANLQMEQQLRERAAAGGLTSSFPSISSLSSYAQSPRALPMAAAAAWGNWRKARDTSIGALSELATNLGNQTPSRSNIGSPASFLSGMITPPATNQKTPSTSDTPMPAPPSMRPLAAATQARKAGGPEARPLRAYNSQPRALSSRQAEKQPESISPPSQLRIEPPRTPTQTKNQLSLDLTEDVDDDASPLDGKSKPFEDIVSPPAE